jgi:hypothetical protein
MVDPESMVEGPLIVRISCPMRAPSERLPREATALAHIITASYAWYEYSLMEAENAVAFLPTKADRSANVVDEFCKMPTVKMPSGVASCIFE